MQDHTTVISAHDHLCLVYRDDATRRAVLERWADEGLQARERVVYIERPDVPDPFPRDVLRFSPEQAFLVDGVADVRARFARTLTFARSTIADGYAGVRMSADVSRALAALPDADAVLGYESMITRLCGDVAVSALCQYAANELDPAFLAAGVAEHQHVRMIDGDGASLELSVTEAGFRVAGEIDLSTRDILAAWLARWCDREADIRIECADLRFVDVGGFRVLAGSGRRVILVRPSRQVEMLLRALGAAASHLPVEVER